MTRRKPRPPEPDQPSAQPLEQFVSLTDGTPRALPGEAFTSPRWPSYRRPDETNQEPTP